MTNKGKTFTLEVWGEYACFTSPLKVERWSYPFITPSAARGIFDAIYCKRRKFRWQIERIELLAEPRYIGLMRNEVKEKADRTMAPIFADATEGEKGRTQRQTMALRDVRYRLSAHIEPWPGAPEPVAAYDEQFLRHAERGQHVVQPCLGCREFPAWWRLAEGEAARWDGEVDAGWMLYDVFDLSRPGEPLGGKHGDLARVSVFHAHVMHGVLDVPTYHDPKVRKGVAP